MDLEDGVPESEKRDAIAAIGGWLRNRPDGLNVFVRVNGIDHPLAEEEKQIFAGTGSVGCVLPKVETVERLRQAKNFYGLVRNPILALIETASAVGNLDRIAGVDGVCALGLGLEDMYSSTPIAGERLSALGVRLRTDLAIAAMTARIGAIDTVSTDIAASSRFDAELETAVSCGMTGKFSIHPTQIDPIQKAFSPSAEDIALALDLAAAGLLESIHVGYRKHGATLLSPPKLRKMRLTYDYAKKHQLV